MFIANKVNGVDFCFRAFFNLKNQIYAVFWFFNNFRLNRYAISPGTLIDVQNSLNVLLNFGFAENWAGSRLDFWFKNFIVNLVVAVKGHDADYRILLNVNDKRIAFGVETDVAEQARII